MSNGDEVVEDDEDDEDDDDNKDNVVLLPTATATGSGLPQVSAVGGRPTLFIIRCQYRCRILDTIPLLLFRPSSFVLWH